MTNPEFKEVGEPKEKRLEKKQVVDYSKTLERYQEVKKTTAENPDNEELEQKLEQAYESNKKGEVNEQQEIQEGKKSLPGINLMEEYRNFDFTKIVKDGKMVEGVEKEDSIGKYIEINNRKFYNVNSEKEPNLPKDEPVFVYSLNENMISFEQIIGKFHVGKGMYYAFSDGSKTDYTFQYSKEEIINSKEFVAIKKYLKKLKENLENKK